MRRNLVVLTDEQSIITHLKPKVLLIVYLILAGLYRAFPRGTINRELFRTLTRLLGRTIVQDEQREEGT